MRNFLSTLSLTGVLSLAAIGVAEAQATIADCEKIQAADAYNQCLAKFGPSGKTLNMEGEKPGDVKGSAEEAAAGAGPAKGARKASGRHRGYGRHAGGGRKRATFTVHRRHR